jgi:hypothetical protein
VRHVARRAMALVPLVAVGALLLSGCNPDEAGAAAVVGSTRISESVVNQDAQEVVDALSKTGAQVPSTDELLRAQVEFRVDAALVDLAAAEKGITISQGQVDQLIESSGGRDTLATQFLSQDGLWLPPSQLDALAREYLIQQALGINLAPGKTADEQGAAATAYVTQVAKDADVSISPRYGTFDVSTLRLGALPNDLSVPAGSAGQASASPAASATPTPSPSAG